jgi:hypothetical protein
MFTNGTDFNLLINVILIGKMFDQSDKSKIAEKNLPCILLIFVKIKSCENKQPNNSLLSYQIGQTFSQLKLHLLID